MRPSAAPRSVAVILGELALAALLIGGPCGGKDGPTAPRRAAIAQVQLTVTSLNPRVGDIVHVGATPVTSTGVPVTGVACRFRSNPPGLAVVDSISGAVITLQPGPVTVTANCGGVEASVVITIRPQLVNLTITTNGDGTGTVFASPAAGLGYEVGTSVTLTARPLTVPPNASLFTGWGGACGAFAANPTCVVVLAGNTAVSATFTRGFALTLRTAGGGSGGITTNPEGSVFAANTVVALTATAHEGSAFAGWADACAGTAPTCNVVMSADRIATAHFEKPVTLSCDYWGYFGRFSSNDGCTWEATVSGSLTARPFTRVDGTVGGTVTAQVNIGITAVVSGCAATPSSFAQTVDLQGTPAALWWQHSGVQQFTMRFDGALTTNRIDGAAVANRTFQGSGPSGTRLTPLTARMDGMYLTP
jgi:hypothetical protein